MAGIESDPVFGGEQGEEMWRSMLNQEYGKEVAKSGRLGIADHVMTAMLKAQEERTVAQDVLAVQQAAAKPVAGDTADDDSVQGSAPALAVSAGVVRREE